jgi:dTDP-4-dehydrorhamnose 3,5-epimerase
VQVVETSLPGLKIVEPKVFGDDRGYFLETWNLERYTQAGIPARFVQDNVSLSERGVLRGLHLQHPSAQGKLVYVLAGEIVDAAVDLRVGSPTFGRSVTVVLSDTNKKQIWVPEGFAHGFCVTSQKALVAYKCSELYRPEHELGVAWNDPDLGIDWPLIDVTLSPRDRAFPRLRDIPKASLPVY